MVDRTDIMDIFEIRTFGRADGRAVMERVSISAIPNPAIAHFYGMGIMQIPTPQGVINHQFTFDIPVDTISEAFSRYDEYGKIGAGKEMKRLQDEQLRMNLRNIKG